ncbi:hypothetical protein GYB22_07935 [bacterium]|nr:hypothetical protein [bacterium]
MNNYKKYYKYIKWFLAIASIGFFLMEWNTNFLQKDLDFGSLLKLHPGIWSIVFLLMICNWAVEAFKFKLLMKPVAEIGFLKSWASVLGGLTVSTLTPARTGEYFGRVLFFKNTDPVKVIIATVTGNIAQVMNTYVFGLLAAVFVFLNLDFNPDLQQYALRLILVAVLLLLLIIALAYSKTILKWILKKVPNKWLKGLRIIKKYDKKQFGRITMLSALRYFIFCLQFYLIIQACSSHALSYVHFLYLPVIFLLQSVAPVPAIADLGFRTYFAALMLDNLLLPHEILLAVTGIWLINLIIPAIVGSVILVVSNFKE